MLTATMNTCVAIHHLPELEQTLKAHGAHHYAIWLDADRNLLFASVEIESEARWLAVAQTEVCQRWWASMKI